MENPSPIARFLTKFIIQPSGCWEWIGATYKGGYGQFWYKGRLVHAHRFAYEYFNNTKILDGMDIDHLCRNPKCVNPAHLEVVTRHENIVRGRLPEVDRQRILSKTHCPHGHPYDEINTYITSEGKRACRICMKEARKGGRESPKIKKEG